MVRYTFFPKVPLILLIVNYLKYFVWFICCKYFRVIDWSLEQTKYHWYNFTLCKIYKGHLSSKVKRITFAVKFCIPSTIGFLMTIRFVISGAIIIIKPSGVFTPRLINTHLIAFFIRRNVTAPISCRITAPRTNVFHITN